MATDLPAVHLSVDDVRRLDAGVVDEFRRRYPRGLDVTPDNILAIYKELGDVAFYAPIAILKEGANVRRFLRGVAHTAKGIIMTKMFKDASCVDAYQALREVDFTDSESIERFINNPEAIRRGVSKIDGLSGVFDYMLNAAQNVVGRSGYMNPRDISTLLVEGRNALKRAFKSEAEQQQAIEGFVWSATEAGLEATLA